MAGQIPTSQDFYDGKEDLKSSDAIINGRDPDTGAPISAWTTRRGDVVRTIPKVISDANDEFDATILGMGFGVVGKFSTGATLTNPRQTLLWDIADGGDGHEYGWSGSFPKVVPPSSTPLTTGGIAAGAWLSRFDPVLRNQVRESYRRSCAEAGLNLVPGSFEAGGTLADMSDVLLHESSGKAFGWAGAFPKVVPAGSGVTGFQDRSNVNGMNAANVKAFGAVGDGVTNDTEAFISATASVNSGVILIPEGTYLLASVNLKSGQYLQCQNAVIRPLTNTSTCMIATNVNNAGIIGNVTFLGSRTDLSDTVNTGERGLEINGGENLILENVTFKRFKGTAYFRGDRPLTYYGNHLQGSNILFVENIIGASIYSQYDTYTNMSAVGNETGVENWGGNLNWSCGNVTDNQIGFAIRDSANNGHGIAAGVQFNHNKYLAIDVDKTQLGFTFADCHVYGFNDGVGRIRVKDSRGVDFTGGAYDCWFEMSERLGILEDCYLRNVYAPGGYGPLKIYNPDTNKRSTSLRVSGVTGPGYINAIDSLNANDLGYVAYAVSRKGSNPQVLNSGDYLVMTTVDGVGDVRGNLDSSGTSIYEYPAVVSGHYNIQLDLVIAGAGVTSCYIETVSDGQTVSYAYGMNIGAVGGKVGYKINATQNVMAANNIRFIVRADGTDLVHALSPFDSKIVIRLMNG